EGHAAADAWRAVVGVRSAAFSDEVEELQKARNNLAIALHFTGDLVGARAQLEELVEQYEKIRPDDDPQLQKMRMNLGTTLNALGELPRAKALLEKVVEIDARTLAPEDPTLLEAQQSLGAV